MAMNQAEDVFEKQETTIEENYNKSSPDQVLEKTPLLQSDGVEKTDALQSLTVTVVEKNMRQAEQIWM
jgi:hypothetical protein